MPLSKTEIIQFCLNEVETKINQLENDIQELNNSLSQETKSTAGDKHETGRAMVQLEIESYSKNLKDKSIQRDFLKRQLSNTNHENLYAASNGTYFLSVGLGKVMINNETIFVISKDSPIGQLLIKVKPGETILLNGLKILINSVE
jgi:predicted RNase H-like nuclease (RuvC/YqgF family)